MDNAERRAQLRAELQELDRQEETARKAVIETQRRLWKTKPRPYTVRPDQQRDGMTSNEPLIFGVRITREVEQDGRIGGMFYYRTYEKILTSMGGGYHLLRIPMLCSDEEWTEILAGRIPAKFLL